LIRVVALKHQEVAVTLTLPLAALGFLSTSLVPRGIEPSQEFCIFLEYKLNAYYGLGRMGEALAYTKPIRRIHMI
jgi:hypothetical protein